ncbi:hypothetical protein CKF54_07100 [Psittacicella hinzii]|uniref:BolA protein n=1 Tax=Psittacicella hinzii TaxID=2028575 RepID=A0A3A1Y1B6_9GAMM|nr:BolA family protein [Psittacicella hinzii]RIY31251.1 hypothetical protein CKF54_07100 [Psittacicella hinzii]
MFIHPNKVQIEHILTKEFTPTHLEVVDESYMHHGGPEAGSHYKVIMASESFVGLTLVQRHRLVNKSLKDVLSNDIHALSLKLFTKSEWENSPEIFESPKCLGKNK